ncbi:aromatic ring-hydroxylating dioxygenase subunit alpha [Candidatus Thioglobus sp. NP1]|uniref:aromatic ring-hydroxylating oxygenase subunit alpha n=1 Tax=Candidatus Thioglobus sp. NP1 TaxID=2508687 RepID=UPI000DEDC1B5|nr:aromatic ring-hydroxylating dioxygenase subunit alpha [Candidatus Thioglobus sp. NP1]AXE61977.1 (2Fe-2S)-binding protein [Candidatus Thioglobus sp. NP1]
MATTPHSNLDSVLTSTAMAKGLPNEHYISDAVFDEEKKAILFNNWSAIGFGKDIPNTGDIKPMSFVDMPLLMARDENNNINVFQNTCRHRGMILIEEPKNLSGLITCPYHSWCYNLKGELCATPMVGGTDINTHKAIKNDELGLFKIKSAVWQDIIFVNISNNAQEFTDYAAKTIERWSEFDKPIYHGGETSSFTLNLNTNWKLAVENYCESYHLPWVHPELNITSSVEDHYHIEEPGFFSGQGSYVYNQIKSEDGSVFPDFEGLSNKWDQASEYIALYPNVLLGTHRDHFFSIIIEPIATNKTVEHVSLYYAKKPEEMPELKPLIDSNALFWKTVFSEDIGVVEGMQRGRKGIMFDGGKFSPTMDSATHCFHRWIANHIKNFRSLEN